MPMGLARRVRATASAVGIVVALCSGPRAAWAAGSAAGAAAVTITTLVDDMPGAGSLAVSPNGQTAYCLDEARRAVVSFDPFGPRRLRDVVAAAGDDLPTPTAIACLPGDVLAVVARRGDDWSLRTFRIRPGAAADPAAPLDSLRLGRASATGQPVGFAVSRSRDWVAVFGLPEPLPSVVRMVFAGAALRPVADAAAHGGAAGTRPVAAAVSPADELVLFEPGGGSPATATVSFRGATATEVLRLDSGLPRVRGAAFGRGDGTLWVIAGEAGSTDRPEGLWRLDAVLRDRVQAVRPTCAARLAAPRSIAAVSDRSVVVATAAAIVRIDPAPGRAKSGSDDDGEEHVP